MVWSDCFHPEAIGMELLRANYSPRFSRVLLKHCRSVIKQAIVITGMYAPQACPRHLPIELPHTELHNSTPVSYTSTYDGELLLHKPLVSAACLPCLH